MSSIPILTIFVAAVVLLAVGAALGWLVASTRQRISLGTLQNKIADLTARYEIRSAEAASIQ